MGYPIEDAVTKRIFRFPYLEGQLPSRAAH